MLVRKVRVSHDGHNYGFHFSSTLLSCVFYPQLKSHQYTKNQPMLVSLCHSAHGIYLSGVALILDRHIKVLRKFGLVVYCNVVTSHVSRS